MAAIVMAAHITAAITHAVTRRSAHTAVIIAHAVAGRPAHIAVTITHTVTGGPAHIAVFTIAPTIRVILLQIAEITLSLIHVLLHVSGSLHDTLTRIRGHR